MKHSTEAKKLRALAFMSMLCDYTGKDTSDFTTPPILKGCVYKRSAFASLVSK